ncbi:PLP-dependent aminotransferase family protein [Alicyclobacillus tolerans]|uniref:aminotransferase-like domain-containing protein n=1 Tax=Alicyclobacillus tolerans TaxID=90970 RepID=UPI001F385C79|nr:PLP-dependent aminotransferase family protein [Alicyclobacillus tolerans]MCF8568035.1 PLP-dependent aminotransferase family protein [Alicyclobacillus tolerans]
MYWKPDLESSEPVFRQIMRYFEERIIRGELSPGQSLPSERSLAEEIKVNRSTVSMAYDELRSTGLVRSVRGRGTHVSEDLWGVIPSRIPNWNLYTSKGAFLPGLPLDLRIREASNMPDIINLARSELSPDLFPVSDLQRLLGKMSLSIPLGYSDPRGARQLRETLVKHLGEQYDIHVDSDQILITTGAQQSLHLITQCLLAPGDSVVLEGPSYAYSLSLFTSAGLRLFQIPMDEYGLQPEEVVELYRRHKVRMVFVNPTYHNPTGTTLTPQRRKRLIEICSELRLPIVEDDAYSALTLDDTITPPSPLVTVEGGYNNVIYLGSMSKTVAPGLRIGWVVGPSAVIQRLADAKEQMDLGTSAISQELARTFIESEWTTHIKKLQKNLSIRRDCMISALGRLDNKNISWTVPNGGYHVWCRTNLTAKDSDILEIGIRHKILFVPGGLYGAQRGYIKFSFARATIEEIEEGIHRFGEILKL